MYANKTLKKKTNKQIYTFAKEKEKQTKYLSGKCVCV